jgi:hypothetical protein
MINLEYQDQGFLQMFTNTHTVIRFRARIFPIGNHYAGYILRKRVNLVSAFVCFFLFSGRSFCVARMARIWDRGKTMRGQL